MTVRSARATAWSRFIIPGSEAIPLIGRRMAAGTRRQSPRTAVVPPASGSGSEYPPRFKHAFLAWKISVWAGRAWLLIPRGSEGDRMFPDRPVTREDFVRLVKRPPGPARQTAAQIAAALRQRTERAAATKASGA